MTIIPTFTKEQLDAAKEVYENLVLEIPFCMQEIEDISNSEILKVLKEGIGKDRSTNANISTGLLYGLRLGYLIGKDTKE